jgi:hypothetical protein
MLLRMRQNGVLRTNDRVFSIIHKINVGSVSEQGQQGISLFQSANNGKLLHSTSLGPRYHGTIIWRYFGENVPVFLKKLLF